VTSLGKPTTQLLLARVFNFVPVFVTSIVTARTLGVDALGEFAYALGIAAIFGLVPNIGIGTVITRAIADGSPEAGALYRSGMRLQILLSASIVLLAPAFAAALPAQQVRVVYVALAAVQVALNSATWSLQAPAVAHLQYGRLAAMNVASGIIAMVLVLAVAAMSGGVGAFLSARILGALASLATMWWVAHPLRPALTTPRLGLRETVRRASPVGLSMVLFTLYERVDTVLLGQLADTRAVGLYNVAYKPANAGKFVGNTLGGTVLPVVARSEGSEPPRAYARILRALGVLGPAMALTFTGLARELIVFVYGVQYSDAAPVATVLVWSLAAAWMYLCISNALIAKNLTRVWAQSLGLALVLNFASNWWAIPRWGALGAAGTTLFTDVLLIVLSGLATWRLLGFAPDFPRIAKIAAATAAALAVLAGYRSGMAFLDTAIALALYGGILFVSGAVRIADIGRVRGWLVAALTGREAS